MRVLAAVMLGCLLAAWDARAIQTSPATSRAIGLPITITGVEGMVQFREGSDKPWQKATVGTTVTEGAEFRTGPRSAVRVLIPPDQTITLDRLGVIKLMQVIQDGNTVKTKVGMPFGRTRYDIEAAGLEHQSELVSPSSTLAIRGTKVSIYDQPPFAPSAVSLTGRAEYRTAKRQVAFGGKNAGRTDVSSTADTPAELSLLQTFVDPNSTFGRPGADKKLLAQLQSKGDVVLNNGQLALAFGPAVTDRQLRDITSDQGRFNISLRWSGPGDFDLFVLTPNLTPGQPGYTLGNPSYNGSIFKDIGLFGPGSGTTQSRTPDGGRIKFDQIAFGGGGLELASWNTPVPQVDYFVAVAYYDHRDKLKGYPVRQKFRVDAVLDGKPVQMVVNLADVLLQSQPFKFGPTYEGTASLIDAEKDFLLPPNSPFKGDVRLTLISLSPDSVGEINPKVKASLIAPPTKRAAAAVPARVMGPIAPDTGRIMGPIAPTVTKTRARR
jgi:hypothetical protein